MKDNTLPVFYSFFKELVRDKEQIASNASIQIEEMRGYFTESIICNHPEKPISKLLKK